MSNSAKKIIIWISAGCLAVLVGLFAFDRYAAGRDYFFDDIGRIIEENSGYALSKTGSPVFSLLPRPTLKIDHIIVTAASDVRGRHIAELSGVTASLKWLPLLMLQGAVDLLLINYRLELIEHRLVKPLADSIHRSSLILGPGMDDVLHCQIQLALMILRSPAVLVPDS